MRNRVAFDKTLLLLIFGFLSFGLVMVFSSSAVATGSSGTFFRQVVFMACGLGAMLVIMRVDYRYFGSKPVILGLLALTYILLLGALASPPINNANRWLAIGPFRAQPSELAKLVAILFTSYFFVRYQDSEPNRREAFTYCAILGSILGLVLVQPDFGTAACIAFIAAVLLFLSGLRLRYFAMALLASIPTFYLLVYRVPYRRDRILAFLDPEADPLGTGYQIRQSLIAIGSGRAGWTGICSGQAEVSLPARGPQRLHFFDYWRGTRSPRRHCSGWARPALLLEGSEDLTALGHTLRFLSGAGYCSHDCDSGTGQHERGDGSSPDQGNPSALYFRRWIVAAGDAGFGRNPSQHLCPPPKSDRSSLVCGGMMSGQADRGGGGSSARVLFAGGGTGGHVYMAVALRQELKKRDPGCSVLFVGTEEGLESRILPPLGFPLKTIPVGGLNRVDPVRMARTLAQLPGSLLGSLRIVRSFRPCAVVGLGGYSSGPVMVAARLTRCPALLIEPNIFPGLTNRVLARWVTRAAVAFQETTRFFGSRAVVTGIPIRREFHQVPPWKPSAEPLRVLIFGGSRGSRPINQVVCDALSSLPQGLQITHQTVGMMSNGCGSGIRRPVLRAGFWSIWRTCQLRSLLPIS